MPTFAKRLWVRTGLALLIGVSTMTACGNDESGLFADWQLIEATNTGVPVELPSSSFNTVHWRFRSSGGCGDCPSGPRLTGWDGCNEFGRGISINDETVVWGSYGETTARACDSAFADVMNALFRADSFQYLVAKDELVVTSTTGELELTFKRT